MGNTQQNIVSLQAAAVTNANGAAKWARWNSTRRNGSAQPVQALQVYPALVPGFVNPIGLQDTTVGLVFLTDNSGTQLTDNSGTLLTE